MQELLDQLITPEVRMVLYLMVICVVMLYILSIVYVIRDAQRRGAEKRIAYRVDKHIGIRMPEQTLFMCDLHAAEYELSPLDKSVDIIALTHSYHK